MEECKRGGGEGDKGKGEVSQSWEGNRGIKCGLKN